MKKVYAKISYQKRLALYCMVVGLVFTVLLRNARPHSNDFFQTLNFGLLVGSAMLTITSILMLLQRKKTPQR